MKIIKYLNLKNPDNLLIFLAATLLTICCLWQTKSLVFSDSDLANTTTAIEEQIETHSLAQITTKDLVQATKQRFSWHTDGVLVNNGTSYYIEDLQHLSNRADYISGSHSPYQAILNFRDQLATKDIQLIIMIVNGKGIGITENPATDALIKKLQQQKITTLHTKNQPLEHYLKHDSHWHPDLMDQQAKQLAEISKPWITSAPFIYQEHPTDITNRGDLVKQNYTAQSAETITTKPVTPSQDSIPPASQILLLGDSYTNIFSAPEMSWGQDSGLGERLSYHLSHPCEVIAINGNGAHSSRQSLARNPEKLNDKKLIIWQFSARELDRKAWKIIPLGLQTNPSNNSASDSTDSYKITAIPTWKLNTPYATSITEILLTRQSDGAEILARMLLKKDHKFTKTLQLKAGQIIHLKLSPWSAVESRYKRTQLHALDRYDLEPYWAEHQE